MDRVASPDGLTVGAIGLLAYMLGNILHEAVGHGSACLLVGAKPLVLSSVHFECSLDNRLVMAGGTLVNLLAGGAFFVFGRLTGRRHPRLKYFFWIAMTVNLFSATGYFLFSGIGGIGDWGEFIQGLGSQWLWRIGLTVFGAATYLLAARISLLELRPLIGSNKEQRYRRAVRLSAIPYFAGGDFDVHIWCAESGGNDPDSDVRRGVDLRRHIRTVMEHRSAQPRNADSLRTTRRTNADS